MADGSQETEVLPEDEGPLFAVVEAWQQKPEARSYINALLKRNKRRRFGLLESPQLGQHRNLEVVSRRLYLVGKSGVGKTSTVDKLCGRDVSLNHEETLGIQTNTVYWPVKDLCREGLVNLVTCSDLVNPKRVILIQLELWDAGERALNKFDHILPTCKQSTHGVMFFFSYIDRHSWEDLPHLISRTVGSDSSTLRVVVGTHADSVTREVTEAEVEQFQRATKLIVLPTANINGPRLEDGETPDGREGIAEITPFMNALTQILLAHKQQQMGSKLAGILSILRDASPDTESPSQ